jgi:type II secretory pathway component PulK
MTALNVCNVKNNRGVALLIVLLVTALLIALVFEFAYATRVSLRAAVNFRDSQRAYFLARSGVNYFIKNAAYIKDNLPQSETTLVPFVSTGDTELRIKWEDEAGKINVKSVRKDTPRFNWLVELFRRRGVSQEMLDKIIDSGSQFQLLTELYQILGDEDYNKVTPFLTVYSAEMEKVNINTASEEVLNSVLATRTGLSIDTILSRRKDQQYISSELTSDYSDFTATSSVSRVYSYATVGGYTKRVEAVTGGNQSYWREL